MLTTDPKENPVSRWRTTWRKEIADEMQVKGDEGPLIAAAPDWSVLDVEFDSDWGSHEGQPFTAWTERRVYFPVVYDGSEWVGSAPRDPCDEACTHVGGE